MASSRLKHQPAFHEPVPAAEKDDGGGIRETRVRTQEALTEEGGSALQKYQDLVSGTDGILGLIKYELITSLLGGLPGLLGLGLRQFFYRFLLKRMGKGAVIGRNVTLRHPNRIQLGDRVVIEDDVVLDAKGGAGDIILGDKVFVGRGTILTCRSGPLVIEEGTSISSYCRIGSGRIGRKVLISAYVYLITGGHRTDRFDIPVIDQPAEYKGGIEVGDGCWIGAFTGVMDGLKIGQHCLVGAHSLVTKDIPPFSVAVGTPAVIKRDRRE